MCLSVVKSEGTLVITVVVYFILPMPEDFMWNYVCIIIWQVYGWSDTSLQSIFIDWVFHIEVNCCTYVFRQPISLKLSFVVVVVLLQVDIFGL